MNRKIEVGCLVMVVRGESTGKVGVAEIRLKSGQVFSIYYRDGSYDKGYTNHDGWSVRLPGAMGVYADSSLLRIDDYDPSQDVVEEDKAVEA